MEAAIGISEPELGRELDRILGKHTGASGPLFGAAFVVINDKGVILHAKAAGSRTFDEQATSPLELDSILWIASITKLFTAISCMVAVEQKLLTLDTNAREIIPEFVDLPLLSAIRESSDGTRIPILEQNDTPITLRQLLSHSSGLVYDQHSPNVKDWARSIGKTEHTFSGSYSGLYAPLVYPPGEGWAYSTGMDWAGRMVEIASGLSLEQFMEQNIWSKLAMHSTTFRPELRADFLAKRMSMAIRNRQDGSLVEGRVPLASPAKDCSGGAGLYSSTRDCAKLLQALMTGGGDILGPSSVDALLSPQLETNKYFLDVIRGPGKGHLGQTWPENVEGTFGLGSSICMEDFPLRRSADSCNWSGMPGLHCVRLSYNQHQR
ncbi:hypothetical protein MBLNU459_g5840t2 [Dothideomycetes sp. NU459]